MKDRICITLHWPGFPETGGEFRELSSFKTHNLEILLHLSGAEHRIKPALNADWSIVTKWNPEQRYSPRGTKTLTDANDMIKATESMQFRSAEESVSQTWGEFTLFGLFERNDIPNKFDVIASAEWLKEDRKSLLDLTDSVRASIRHDNWWSRIGKFVVLSPQDPFVKAVLKRMPSDVIEHDLQTLTDFTYEGDVIRNAVIITALKNSNGNMAAHQVAA